MEGPLSIPEEYDSLPQLNPTPIPNSAIEGLYNFGALSRCTSKKLMLTGFYQGAPSSTRLSE
jgi:hypothetical protein